MKIELTAVFEKRGKYYIAYIEEIPGVNTQGKTLEEARENLKEALELVIQTNRELTRRRIAEEIIREPLIIKTKK